MANPSKQRRQSKRNRSQRRSIPSKDETRRQVGLKMHTTSMIKPACQQEHRLLPPHRRFHTTPRKLRMAWLPMLLIRLSLTHLPSKFRRKKVPGAVNARSCDCFAVFGAISPLFQWTATYFVHHPIRVSYIVHDPMHLSIPSRFHSRFCFRSGRVVLAITYSPNYP